MNNKTLVRYFYEVIVSEHRLSEVAQFVSDDCVICVDGQELPLGVDGMCVHLAAVRKTYSQYEMKILRQFEEHDTVVSEFKMTAYHDGEWLGMAPTGKQLVFYGVDIDTVIDGKIVRHGGAVNTFETLWGAGLLEAKERAQC